MGRVTCNSSRRAPTVRKRAGLRWLWRWCPCGDCARRRRAATLPGGIHWIRLGDEVIYRARRPGRLAADDCAKTFDNLTGFGGWPFTVDVVNVPKPEDVAAAIQGGKVDEATLRAVRDRRRP